MAVGRSFVAMAAAMCIACVVLVMSMSSMLYVLWVDC